MKRALVVSGGGAKGAFAVGAIEILKDHFGLEFDMVTGTSTGSLIAPFVAAGEHLRLIQLYGGLTTGDFLKIDKNVALSLFFDDAIFDVSPFRGTLKTEVTEAIAAKVFDPAAPRIIIATTALQSGDLWHFHTFASDKFVKGGHQAAAIRDRAHLLQVMEASSNQPVFMTPVRLKTSVDQSDDDVEQFVDGGVRSYAPIRVAIENGATEIYAILLSPEKAKPVTKQYKAAYRILGRTFNLFMENVGHGDVLAATDAAKAAGARIQWIRPLDDPLTDSLDISPQVQGKLMELGRERALAVGKLSDAATPEAATPPIA